LVHADLYRLNNTEEVYGIGLEEALEGDAVGLVEWAERFPEVLPDDRLDLRLSFVHGTSLRRQVALDATGDRAQAWLAQLRSEIEALVGTSSRG
jgi:tRNA A37 threonylcarbamoyladenosine biosynthesis protein TsaE